MSFAEKLSSLRKQRGLTQEEMAIKAGVGIAQIRRYEGGKSSPTLEIIKNIAKFFNITTDELIFNKNESVITSKIIDQKLLEQFEIVAKMSVHDKEAIKTILDSMILKNKLEDIMPDRKDSKWTKEMRQVVNDLKEGAKGYSDDEIDSIVDDAVKAVRAEDRAGENLGA